MTVLLANNATSKLASSLTALSTTLTVTAGQGARFPSPTGGDWFPLTAINNSGQREVMRCTARGGDVFTVTRAQEGTSAQVFDVGDIIELRTTKGVFDQLKTDTAAAKAAADAAQSSANAAQSAADDAQDAADAAQASANTANSKADALDLNKQPKDATLTALACVAATADKLPYFNGADTAAVTDFTAKARELLAGSTPAAMRTVLGTPAGVDKQICSAWVNFDGTGSITIRDSFNVSSITDENTGRYVVNFATPLANTNYSAFAHAATDSESPNGFVRSASDSQMPVTKSTAALTVGYRGAITWRDTPDFSVLIMGGK